MKTLILSILLGIMAIGSAGCAVSAERGYYHRHYYYYDEPPAVIIRPAPPEYHYYGPPGRYHEYGYEEHDRR